MAVSLSSRNSLHHLNPLRKRTVNSLLSQYYSQRSSLSTRKFPQNSTPSIYQLTTNSFTYNQFLISSRYASTKAPQRKASTSTSKYTLSHNQRVFLRQAAYWSPRIVLGVWIISFLSIGAYLLKKSVETDGFSTSKDEGVGADIAKEDWSLIDVEGHKYCRDDTLGKYMLIYFGFTFCPDVCPVEMKKLAEIADNLKERGIGLDIVQPTFVSVDYRRDTPEMIKNYIRQFTNGDDTKIKGLCGTREQIEHFARVMRTYFSDPPQLQEDYILEHSTYMYFTGTDGGFKQLTNTEDGSEVLANKVALWVAEDKGTFSKIKEQVQQAIK